MERRDRRIGHADTRPTSPAPVIPQRMLAEYGHLKLMKARFERLRKQLLHLLENGAVVEDGRLNAEVHFSTQRRLTIEALVDLLGPEEVEQLRDAVAPTVYRALTVTARASRARRHPARRLHQGDGSFVP